MKFEMKALFCIGWMCTVLLAGVLAAMVFSWPTQTLLAVLFVLVFVSLLCSAVFMQGKPKKRKVLPKEEPDIHAKYPYIGSVHARKVHTSECRLGKLVKEEYKEGSYLLDYFTKKRFKKCKVCF